MAVNTNSNELLKFMNTATSNIQEALGRSNKSKKVNHRKYLEKRLQRGPKNTKKPKNTQSTMINRQPIARLTPATKTTVQSQYIQSSQNEFDQLYNIVSQPSVFPSSHSFGYSTPPSVHEELCDPEIESLLSEFVDSPSCSLYGDSRSGTSSSRGSIVSSMCSSGNLLDSSVIPSSDFYALSPPSDFSDFDESNYSSPRNPSPVNTYYSTASVSPSPSGMYYQQHVTATYDCIPTNSTLAVGTIDQRPNGLSLPYHPSITELLAELVSTP